MLGGSRARPAEADRPRESLLASLRHQVLRPRTLAPAAIAVAAVGLALRGLLGVSFGAVWDELRDANPLLLALALGVFYLSFPIRALRWRVLLQNVGIPGPGEKPLPTAAGLTRMMVLASFANSVSVAQLGDLYRAYLLKQKSAVSYPATLGTILAERLVDVVTLVGLLAAAALTVYAGRLPRQATDALLVGLALSLAGVAVLVLLPRLRPLAERVVPSRWRGAYARLETGAAGSLKRLPVLVGYSVLAWLVEGLTLYLLGAAVGLALPGPGALVAGLVASLLSVEPVTPGGLGVTEPGIVLVLTSLGIAPAGAAAVALLNRFVNYASLAVAGGALYVLPTRPGAAAQAS